MHTPRPDLVDTCDEKGNPIRLPDNVRHHTEATVQELHELREIFRAKGATIVYLQNFRDVVEVARVATQKDANAHFAVYWVPDKNRQVMDMFMAQVDPPQSINRERSFIREKIDDGMNGVGSNDNN